VSLSNPRVHLPIRYEQHQKRRRGKEPPNGYACIVTPHVVPWTDILAAVRTFSNARTSICRMRSRDTLNSIARSSNVFGSSMRPNDWTKIYPSTRWSGRDFPTCCSPLPDRCFLRLPRPGAWYLLRREYHASRAIMLRMGLGLAAVLSRSSFSSDIWSAGTSTRITLPRWLRSRERWNDEKPGSEVLFAGRM